MRPSVSMCPAWPARARRPRDSPAPNSTEGSWLTAAPRSPAQSLCAHARPSAQRACRRRGGGRGAPLQREDRQRAARRGRQQEGAAGLRPGHLRHGRARALPDRVAELQQELRAARRAALAPPLLGLPLGLAPGAAGLGASLASA